jgi:hypothetical protein
MTSLPHLKDNEEAFLISQSIVSLSDLEVAVKQENEEDFQLVKESSSSIEPTSKMSRPKNMSINQLKRLSTIKKIRRSNNCPIPASDCDKVHSLPPGSKKSQFFNHICSYCTRAFRTPRDKYQHLEDVHKMSLDKRCKCPAHNCEYEFDISWLMRHIRKAHPNDPSVLKVCVRS